MNDTILGDPSMFPKDKLSTWGTYRAFYGSSDLDRRFGELPDTPARYEELREVRASFLPLAAYLNGCLPEGREKSLVLTKLEEAMFWAIAAKERSA